jgi:hypothetical protein
MKVIGIDVAPRRGGHVCDGVTVTHMKPAKLAAYLNDLNDSVLLAWDAPLTGPRDPDRPFANEQDLTIRTIEKFFRKGGPLNPPEGISTLGYGNCPHWTITRALLGLPRVGRFDAKSDLPFHLITNDEDRPSSGRHVVEVHPAIALWLWCKADGYDGASWRYKGAKKDVDCAREVSRLISVRLQNEKVSSARDDELDAWIAWYLADRWLNDNGVMLLGNERDGCFLLPKDDALSCEFKKIFRSVTGQAARPVIFSK